jgi:hypothetical protein
MPERWRPCALDQLIDELAEQGRRWLRDRRHTCPRVTLYLCSGRRLVGVLLDVYDDRRGNRTLFLARGAAGEASSTRVVAVAAARVEAIGLEPVELPTPDSASEPPAPLALRRQAQALGERIGGRLGVPLSIELADVGAVDQRRRLAAALVTLESVLVDASADALGRQALCDRVRTITLVTGSGFELTLAEGVCRIVVGAVAPTVDDLRARLYAQL